MSLLDAAAKILAEVGEPMACQEMVSKAGEKGYWTSPAGRTPQATLYSAIIMEIKKKGTDARFVKTERGKFGLAAPKVKPAKPAKSGAAETAAALRAE